MRLRELRVLASEGAQPLLRLVEALRAEKRDRQVEARRHVIGRVPERAAQAALRLLDLVAIEVNAAEAVPGGDVLRHLLQDLPVARGRRIQLFEVVMHRAELVAHAGQPGLALERLAEGAQGPLQVALRPEHAPQALPAARGLRRTFDRAPERVARALEVAALMQEQAEVLQREGMVPVPREKAPVSLPGRLPGAPPGATRELRGAAARPSRAGAGAATESRSPVSLPGLVERPEGTPAGRGRGFVARAGHIPGGRVSRRRAHRTRRHWQRPSRRRPRPSIQGYPKVPVDGSPSARPWPTAPKKGR